MNFDVNSKSDEELVKLSLVDSNYYLYLMKRYESKLMRYVFRLSRVSREDAEDIIQEVFISVFKNLNSFNTELKFSSWIYRITHNKTISFYRKNKKIPTPISFEEGNIFELISESKEMEIEINSNFEMEKLIDAINKLDIKYKSVLILRFVEGKEYSEISEILKIPINTVGTYINRSKKILKKNLN